MARAAFVATPSSSSSSSASAAAVAALVPLNAADAVSAVVATAGAPSAAVRGSDGDMQHGNAVTSSSGNHANEQLAAGSGGGDGDKDEQQRSERLERQRMAQQLRLSARRLTRPSDAASMERTVATGARKPPLARKPANSSSATSKTTNGRSAQRRESLPGIDFDQTLFQFANCMRREFEELVDEFVKQREITFAAFKHLWRERRMSAAFHVEFWESTPTTTHQTILQMALDLLVCWIEDHTPFATGQTIATLFGYVFALYSAYSVQLGTPKHKIDIDPQSWTALMGIEFVAAGLGAALFPQAAKQVLRMLHTLAVKENAFLKCLRGFGHQFRVKSGRVHRDDARSITDAVGSTHVFLSQPLLTYDQVQRLETLNAQYAEAIARVDPTSIGGKPRGRLPAKSTLSSSLPAVPGFDQAHEKSRAELLARFQSYLTQKSTPQSQNILELRHNLQTARDQQQALRSHADAESVHSYDEDTHFAFEEPAALQALPIHTASLARHAAPSSRVAMSVASSKSDGLAELEAELSRDIYSSILDPANQTEKSITAQKQARDIVRSKPLTEITTTTSGRKRSRAQSVASVDSVGSAVSGLTDLQAELDASSSLVRTRHAGSANVRSSTHDAQSDAVASSTDSDEIDESDDGLAELEAELEAEVGASEKKKPATRQAAKKTKAAIPRAASKRAAVREPKANDALAPVRRRKLSDAISIATESDDGLAALQAELELSVEAVPMPKPATRPTRATTRQLPKAAASPVVEQKKQMRGGIAAQRTQNGSDQVSIASESDNGLAALQAELDMLVAEVRTAVAVNSTTAQVSQGKSASKKASAQRPRRAFSDVASIATESDDGLRELQAELELFAMEAPAAHAAVATKPATRASRSKKAIPPATVSQKIHPRAIAAKTRKRTFDAASIATESDDGLAELQAELVMGAEERPSFDAATTSPPAGRARTRRAAKGQATEPLLQKSPGIAARLTNDAVSIATLESDDGLAELEAELEFSSAVEPAVASAPAKAKRSAKRIRTSDSAENPSDSKTATAVKRQSTSRSTRPGSSADGMVPPTGTPAPRRTRAAASTQKSTPASQKPKPVKTTVAKTKLSAAATEAAADKAPTRRQKQIKAASVAPRQSRKNEQPTTNAPSPSQQLQSSRHAALLLSAARSVASDDESDGLDDLEAELQTSIV